MSKALLLLFLTSGTVMFGTFAATPAMGQSTPASATAVPVYPDTADGLETLVRDIFRAEKNKDAATYNSLISSLSQPVSSEWFNDAFGDDGEMMFKEYPLAGPHLAAELQTFFAKLRDEKFTQVTAHKHEASCDDNSGELIYPVMVMRQRPVPLYELRFHDGAKFYRLWALAYVDGGFRFVGDLHPPEFRGGMAKPGGASGQPGDAPKEHPKRIRIGGNVAAAKLVHKVQPEYPEIARYERLQGTVRLHAVIGVDGTIQLLRVQTGYCSLGEASLKAVRQWRYAPVLMNGEPVEVDTTIDVIFSLKS